ncbi:MAG: CRISPR-associated protein Cas4 [Bdellovibrionota bacterium]
MIKKVNGKYIISAGELGIYVVCPYAWKLKSVSHKKLENADVQKESTEGKKLHKEWSKETEDIHILRTKKSLVLGLLSVVILSSIFFLKDKILKSYNIESIKTLKLKSTSILSYLINEIKIVFAELGELDLDVLMFVVLTSISLFVVYIVSVYVKKRAVVAGIDEKSKLLALEHSKILPSKDYISYTQGISGKPDAVIKEGAYFIPVEIKPLAKKLRDRYVYQLLVYMRLISEFKKKDVPYGYLILGPKAKRVRINNLPERQKNLNTFLSDMNDILNNKKEALASPSVQKCSKCNVAKYCKFNACKP